ncbi:MAG TPA: LysR family transcriptional regulator [Candidatus Lachnoclostridium avicola]|nr:LysR family transcriptional regulator [Candidatus Lachnoclostridium avicola]
MNTKILEYFIAAAEEQNISRAAERCYISQPALS